MANSSGLVYEKESIKNSNILRSIVLTDGQSLFLDDEQMGWGGCFIFRWEKIHLHLAAEKTKTLGSKFSCPKSHLYKCMA